MKFIQSILIKLFTQILPRISHMNGELHITNLVNYTGSYGRIVDYLYYSHNWTRLFEHL